MLDLPQALALEGRDRWTMEEEAELFAFVREMGEALVLIARGVEKADERFGRTFDRSAYIAGVVEAALPARLSRQLIGGSDV